MIKTLYKTFQHWSATGSVYIISDPHFMDYDMNWRTQLIPELKQYTKWNNYSDYTIAYELAMYIVNEINCVCKKNDTIILCGDIGEKCFIKLLKANKKILIKGNHDRGNSFYEDCFDEVYDGPLMISNKIMLSHEPIKGPWLNIHGHVHHVEGTADSYIQYIYDVDDKIKYSTGDVNVSCEVNSFKPINLGELIKTGVLNQIDDIHRVTIDKASSKQ